MSESLDRLRRLQALRPQRTPAESQLPLAPGDSDAPTARALEELVPGRLYESEVGGCYGTEERYRPGATRGLLALEALLEFRPATMAPFHPRCGLEGPLEFRDAAFIDTETTGLGMAGVYAFMVGVGTFEPAVGEDGLMHDQYVVRQLFMRSPAEEPALLAALAEMLSERTLSVTFNGRAFDLPLLRARFAANRPYLPAAARRVPLLADQAPQLDLLLPARKLWRRRLQSCRLINLEEQILGLRRSGDDVPGFLIPQLYVDYVRSGNARFMQRVFTHNREDIVSTTAIAAELCRQIGATAASDRTLHGLDWFSLARSCETAGDLDGAETAYRRALDGLNGNEQREAFRCLAALLKRRRRWAEAVALWELWLTTIPGSDMTAYLELAKYYEWEARDLEQAEVWCAFGVHTARALPAWKRLPGQLGDLEHRLERIRRKRAGAA